MVKSLNISLGFRRQKKVTVLIMTVYVKSASFVTKREIQKISIKEQFVLTKLNFRVTCVSLFVDRFPIIY